MAGIIDVAAGMAQTVKVVGLPDAWASRTGGETSVSVTKNWNGGSRLPSLTKGRVELSNLVIGRPYSIVRDRAMIRQLRKDIEAGKQFTLTVQDLDPNDVAIGRAETFTGCLIVRIKAPEYDATKADGSMVELEFMPQNVT